MHARASSVSSPLRDKGPTGLFSFLLAFAVLVVPACSDDDGPPVPPVGGGGGTRGTGMRDILETDGLVGSTTDAGARPPPLGSNGNRDASAGPDAAVDAAPPDAAMRCGLVMQDCPASQGCYPDGQGVTRCKGRGAVGENGQCSESDQCDRGLVCAGAEDPGQPLVCQRLCHPVDKPCLGQETCRALPYVSAGYCIP